MIDCGNLCSETFDPFTEILLEDSGDPGTFFAGWVSGCDEVNVQNQCLVILTADREVVAAYE